MRRREFIVGLGSAAMWPVVARAQQSGSVRRVGILTNFTAGSPTRAWVDAFKRELAGLGWVEGRDVRFEDREPNNDADLPAVATELARLAPDAIFVAFSPALRAMRRASADIPIVFAQVGDPVEQGFVSSLAHPGGNITGFAAGEFGIHTKQLDLLKNLAPSLERVALLYDPGQLAASGVWDEMQAAAPSLTLKASRAAVRTAEDIERVITTLAREPNSGVLVSPGRATVGYHEMIAMLALRHRLPAVYNARHYVESGGLISYGPDQIVLFRRAASYVDRILRGEKPRPTGAATDEVRDGPQPQDCEGDGARRADQRARAC
jgi:putative ABC transport system substrate-binding protein